MNKTIGINVGASSLKLVETDNNTVVHTSVIPHDGDVPRAIKQILGNIDLHEYKTLVTGTEGRYLFNLPSVIEPICIERALQTIEQPVDAVVSVGGEDLILYVIENGSINGSLSGNKCASGTGEFFKQQLGRMNLTLDHVNEVSEEHRVLPLSSRCSVFMKSDCTHRLNKNEATKEDIVLSLSYVMAVKISDFLKRSKISSGNVLLAGGVTKNRHILRFLKEILPEVTYIVPNSAPWFEALGASLLAGEMGEALKKGDEIFSESRVKYPRLEPFSKVEHLVKRVDEHFGVPKAGHSYILGIDGGSTTTKACLIDRETSEIVAQHYGRTHGDPVKALKGCLQELKKQVIEHLGSFDITINLVATTGSSREILGVFSETQGVYNEIIAHGKGTAFFDASVDTIFEIGGQDAKYILLKNRVPIDYAMNEACSAGTGSFLEESAAGDLNIGSAVDIGPIAMQAKSPLKFGEHCSAFINSDIRKAIQQGASKEDITAGIVASIVSNYLNRVIGNRTIGNHIFLQGGVAKNPAVPLAFALLLQKEIIVPPSPELMGCFGVGLLAQEKADQGFLDWGEWDIDELIEREISYNGEFTCKACDNYCPIQRLQVSGSQYMFGGRCNKYANIRKKVDTEHPPINYVDKRNHLLFEECGAPPVEDSPITVGIPLSFSVHSLYPLYSWFFHELGIKTVLSDEVDPEGSAKTESAYCFPAEIAHGAVQNIMKKGCDYIFVPHYRDMESYEKDVHANFCPITQSLPYYIKKAFPEIPEEKILSPVITFKFGDKKAEEFFQEIGQQLGKPSDLITKAFTKAKSMQDEYAQKLRAMGVEALAHAKTLDQPVIALLGRPYNAFTPDANMGIPRKFTSRSYTVIPFDMLPIGDEEIYPNMYWYYGQQDMKAVEIVKDEPNIYVTYITNFSCAPDSFLLHYLKWQMGTKPFLVLELDSHSADAGIDTRIEAFLDIIEGYNLQKKEKEERYDNGLSFVSTGDEHVYVHNKFTDEKIPIRNNPRVKLMLANMGDFATELMSAFISTTGIQAQPFPTADARTLHLARMHSSGKECIPAQLVLGSILKFLESDQYRKDEIYLVFVPITTGPCRTGQYYVFYENLFKDLRVENVVIFTLSADNSYNELGPGFSKYMWKGLALSDYIKDIEYALRVCAEDRPKATEQYMEWRKELIQQIAQDPKKLYKHAHELGKKVATIPLKKSVTEVPRVLVVGEIYVRRDDFAVNELVETISKRGVLVKVSGIAEWIHYLDFVRKYDYTKKLKLVHPLKRLFSKPMRDLITLKIEQKWKHRQEKKAWKALAPSNLLPPEAGHMDEAMELAKNEFVNLELNSEIVVSSGVAGISKEHGYSGVVNIAPFACLIGRVIEGIYTPWAREQGYPTISIEVDGDQIPPNLVNKIEIFLVNVMRYNHDPKTNLFLDD